MIDMVAAILRKQMTDAGVPDDINAMPISAGDEERCRWCRADAKYYYPVVAGKPLARDNRIPLCPGCGNMKTKSIRQSRPSARREPAEERAPKRIRWKESQE